MNAITQITVSDLPALGASLGGGFYAGIIDIDGQHHALVVSPKTNGEFKEKYGEVGETIEGAGSYADGFANTEAMAKAGSALAKQIRALSINGYTDWAIPARDQLELLYRNLKPSTEENWCSFRDGDNPSSLPAGYPYTKQSPVQTSAEAFKTGGAEAFEEAWYWASTQCSANGARSQGFDGGRQGWDLKNLTGRARAVRVIPLA